MGGDGREGRGAVSEWVEGVPSSELQACLVVLGRV